MDEEPAQSQQRQRQWAWLAPLLIVAVGVAAYANGLGAGFVFDDVGHIVENRGLRELWPIADHLRGRRPMVELSFAINYAVNEAVLGDGLSAAGFRAVNIAIHIAAALLLLGIVRQTLSRTRSPATALSLGVAVALLWVAHPLTTQAVTYLTQRGESLMAMLYLLTLYCFIRATQRADGGEDDKRKAWPALNICWTAGAVLACWLALATKEVAITLPAIVLLYDRTFVAGSFVRAISHRWFVHGLLWAGAAGLLWAAFGPASSPAAQPEATAGFAAKLYPPTTYALNQCAIVLHYLRLSVWPAGLTLDYAWQPAASTAQLLPAIVIICLLLAASVFALWRWPRVGFVAASIFIVLLPTSSILPIADMAVEHRMYLPLAGVVVLIVLAASTLLQRYAGAHWRAVAGGLLAVVVVSLGITTAARNHDYASPVTIWQDTANKAPANSRAWDNLGMALLQVNKPADAAQAFKHALQLEPGHAKARVNLGIALAQLGQYNEAAANYAQVLDHLPDYAPALHNLALVYAKAGQLPEAENLLRQAVASDPALTPAWADLGTVLAQQNRLDDAVVAYRNAIELNPSVSAWHNSLGTTYARQGNLPAARTAFQTAVSLDPSNQDAAANLARVKQMLTD